MARILFVEDEEAVLKRLLKYFEREGFEVRGAQTGAEALEAAASFHPDVAVLDVMLHEGPGGMVFDQSSYGNLGPIKGDPSWTANNHPINES